MSGNGTSQNFDAAFGQVMEIIQAGQRFLLTGHVRADGDCIGAQTALYHLLQGMGKEPIIMNPDPVSPRYRFMQEHTRFLSFEEEGKVPEFDALFVLDINTLDRTAGMADPLRSHKGRKIVFDHHQTSQGEKWDIEIIDPSAAATGLLVHRFACNQDLDLNEAAAEGIFLSLVTDTGWFKYSNTDAETFRVAGELAAKGVDPARVFQHVYQQRSQAWTKGLIGSLESVKFHLDGRLAVAMLPEGIEGVDPVELADTEEILDILRAVGPVEVVAVLRQESPDTVKVSFRSKGDFNVNQFARNYGGGGHRRAAGTEISGKLREVTEKVSQELCAAMNSGA